jgi:hypothetical protein
VERFDRRAQRPGHGSRAQGGKEWELKESRPVDFEALPILLAREAVDRRALPRHRDPADRCHDFDVEPGKGGKLERLALDEDAEIGSQAIGKAGREDKKPKPLAQRPSSP